MKVVLVATFLFIGNNDSRHRKIKQNLLRLPIFGIFNFLKVFSMGKNTSISLGNHFEEFINNEIKSGRYGSVSEVIRTALRLLESEERKLNEIRNALIVGEESSWVEDFNPEEHLKSLHKKYSKE
jgi:antitoxin ParD1/3/4